MEPEEFQGLQREKIVTQQEELEMIYKRLARLEDRSEKKTKERPSCCIG